MNWTKEPWMILDEGDVLEINNGTNGVTSTCFDYSKDQSREQVLIDYSRIVACVNACAGIETVQLEVLDIKGAVDGADLARQQRDKLLVSLKEVCDRNWAYSGAVEMAAMNAARIVIEEVEATK
jgi:hypothetical protein